MTPLPRAPHSQSPRFATTRWSLVLQAKDKGDPDGVAALAELCRAYWYPLYSFLRRRSRDVHDAQDLTQGFFSRLLEKDFLDDVQPERGRFRSFLLVALKHYVSNERDRDRAAKRGGGRRERALELSAFDWESGESRYLTEPADYLTPERLFERQWALALLERVLMRLRDEYASAGKTSQFEVLRPYLSADNDKSTHADVASSLKITPDAARVTVHRLRKRYRQLLRDEIAQTVASSEQIDDEIRHLFDVLASP